MATRWERLEEYLFDHEKHGSEFTASEYAAEMGFDDVSEGTRDIQDYLAAQRRKKSKTLYVMRRVPGTRTKSARWMAGVKTRDARMVGKGLADDVGRTVMRAFVPDLLAIKVRNPRAGRQAENQIKAIVEGAMVILAAAAEGISPDGDGGD